MNGFPNHFIFRVQSHLAKNPFHSKKKKISFPLKGFCKREFIGVGKKKNRWEQEAHFVPNRNGNAAESYHRIIKSFSHTGKFIGCRMITLCGHFCWDPLFPLSHEMVKICRDFNLTRENSPSFLLEEGGCVYCTYIYKCTYREKKPPGPTRLVISKWYINKRSILFRYLSFFVDRG